MTMTNTLKNKIFHGFLKPMQESVSNGTLNAEELYRDLCIIVRLESDTESDAMCSSDNKEKRKHSDNRLANMILSIALNVKPALGPFT